MSTQKKKCCTGSVGKRVREGEMEMREKGRKRVKGRDWAGNVRYVFDADRQLFRYYP